MPTYLVVNQPDSRSHVYAVITGIPGNAVSEVDDPDPLGNPPNGELITNAFVSAASVTGNGTISYAAISTIAPVEIGFQNGLIAGSIIIGTGAQLSTQQNPSIGTANAFSESTITTLAGVQSNPPLNQNTVKVVQEVVVSAEIAYVPNELINTGNETMNAKYDGIDAFCSIRVKMNNGILQIVSKTGTWFDEAGNQHDIATEEPNTPGFTANCYSLPKDFPGDLGTIKTEMSCNFAKTVPIGSVENGYTSGGIASAFISVK